MLASVRAGRCELAGRYAACRLSLPPAPFLATWLSPFPSLPACLRIKAKAERPSGRGRKKRSARAQWTPAIRAHPAACREQGCVPPYSAIALRRRGQPSACHRPSPRRHGHGCAAASSPLTRAPWQRRRGGCIYSPLPHPHPRLYWRPLHPRGGCEARRAETGINMPEASESGSAPRGSEYLRDE